MVIPVSELVRVISVWLFLFRWRHVR